MITFHRENISSRFTNNSEAFASELLENLEECKSHILSFLERVHSQELQRSRDSIHFF